MENKSNQILIVLFIAIVLITATRPESKDKNVKFYEFKAEAGLEVTLAKKETQETQKVSGVFVTKENKKDLTNKTQIYINKFFKDTPASAAFLVEMAEANNFPLDFLLVSGHLESHMCTKGRAKPSKNCHNVDNTDGGDNLPTVCGQYTVCLESVKKGSQKFINLIQNCYFKQNEIPSIQGFINYDFRIQRRVPPFCGASVGSRYMTDTRARAKYENAIINYINPIFGK